MMTFSYTYTSMRHFHIHIHLWAFWVFSHLNQSCLIYIFIKKMKLIHILQFLVHTEISKRVGNACTDVHVYMYIRGKTYSAFAQDSLC